MSPTYNCNTREEALTIATHVQHLAPSYRLITGPVCKVGLNVDFLALYFKAAFDELRVGLHAVYQCTWSELNQLGDGARAVSVKTPPPGGLVRGAALFSITPLPGSRGLPETSPATCVFARGRGTLQA